MTLRWYVVKYVPDLTRGEPRNMGLVLVAGDAIISRFLGESGGEVDGRKVRSRVNSVEIYKGWVDYWHSSLSVDSVGRLAKRRRPGDNYFLELGGERAFGAEETAPSELFEKLYAHLVEARSGAEVVTRNPFDEVVEAAVGAENVQRNWVYQVPNSPDVLRFDYRFDNGAVNLLQRVNIRGAGATTWTRVHSFAWQAERTARATIDGKRARPIALIQPGAEVADLHRFVGTLKEAGAAVVDVSAKPAAAELRRVMHLAG